MVPHWGCDTCAGNEDKFYSAENSTTSKLIYCNDPRYKCSKCSPDNGCIYTVAFVGMFLFLFCPHVNLGITETVLLSEDTVTLSGVDVEEAHFGAITEIDMSFSKL